LPVELGEAIDTFLRLALVPVAHEAKPAPPHF
jgi:hypothetical protein